MLRKTKKLAMYTAIVAAAVATMPAQMKAQQGGSVNLAAMQSARQDYDTDQLRQQIARDRSGVVADLMSRWASDIGSTEKGQTGWQTRLSTVDAETLRKMSQASSWDAVVNLALGLTPGVNAFGSLTQDLVFNPVTPCRVMDTRFGTGAWAGPFSSPQTVSFYVTDALNANGHTQGGLANCGFPFAVGTGVALNITVVTSGPGATSGDVKIYPFGGAEPNASIVNFSTVANFANAADVAIATSNVTNDVTIKVEFANNVNLVVDVVGYFAAPHVSALDVVRTASAVNTVANGASYDLFSPVCPTGYSLTGGGFNETSQISNHWLWQSSPDNAVSPGTRWEIRGYNLTGGNLTLTVYAQCARTPGR